ncbi:MAG: carbohydrate ABC transporter permease [Candidatus Promineifilaceae bacterium]|nr:carbohydrate ABC transporter permease [Candidatus Promineifilaceae bacterium]
MIQSQKSRDYLQNLAVYAVLTFFAFVMLFPFIFMLSTSFKTPKDTFRYPPRLLPRAPITVPVEGFEEELPLYHVTLEGEQEEFALVESSIRIGIYAPPAAPEQTVERPVAEVRPTGGFMDPETTTFGGEEVQLYDVEVEGEAVPMVQVGQTALGRFVDPQNPEREVLRNVRLSEPVEVLTARPENYEEVIELQNMDRSLTNTILVTLAVVLGTLATSVLGGYAFARLRFPGRDNLFVLYLGTIMIPFVVLVTPMYQLMVAIGWVDRVVSLIIPWIFSAYGTFLMRQFFITVPREIEEAALIDGASRLQILRRIFLPASTPALATLATFTFLYAWNSFFWPLVVINTGNTDNHVLTLSLNVLRGRASDSPNLILAGAAIAILPPMLVFILGQRFFVESATSSGLKG